MPHRVRLASLLFVCLAAGAAPSLRAADDGASGLALIPWPRSVQRHPGDFEITEQTRLRCNIEPTYEPANILAADIWRMTGRNVERGPGTPRGGDIVLAIDHPKLPDRPRDGYRISVGETITITGDSPQGLSYGTATLLQLIHINGRRMTVPKVEVADHPQFAYSAAMLDVARKPYSVETLCRCIDACRFYKVRFLHLHMTDENAWTFPSREFPKLGSQNFAWAGGEAPQVYRREQLRFLVEFAQLRGVVLVPEIEMPGHSGQLRGTLPDIFGYRRADGTPASAGVINMTSDKALQAIDKLIGEVCEIFPTSPYIHVGGDEASLGGLEDVPEVAAFMKDQKLEGTHAVFNEFMHKVHKMVTARGRQMIVWEGVPNAPKPLPNDVIFMPWVGGSAVAGELVKQGYRVINAPWGVEKPYFDPYKVNAAQLDKGEPKLIGATSILWESTEDRALPYLRFTGALRGEPTWNPESGRDFEDFVRRVDRTDRQFDRLLCGFTIDMKGALPRPSRKSLEPAFLETVELTPVASQPTPGIRYTLDGSEPTLKSPVWTEPITISETTTLTAIRFGESENPQGSRLVRTFRKLLTLKHDALGAKVTLSPDRPGYAGPGPQGLTDGRLADGNEFDQQGWVGWANNGQPVTITLDLGKPLELRRLAAHTLRSSGGVFPPAKIEWLVSDDGQEFRPVASVAVEQAMSRRGWFVAELKEIAARYVQLKATHAHDWVFLDEISVNGELDPPTLRALSVGKPVTIAAEPSTYTAPGTRGLTDGYVSQEPNFLSLEWLGFDGRGADATIDLGESKRIKSAGGRFLQDARAGIWLPAEVEVLVSDDGKEFRSVGTFQRKGDSRPKALELLKVELKDVTARYVRVKAPAAGQWQFVDEIVVE